MRSSSDRCRAPCDRRSPGRRRRAFPPARPPRASARRRDRPAARAAARAPSPARSTSRAASSRSGLDERLADRHAARLEERVGHRAADEQRVDARDQVLDDLELVRHLRAAEDRDERPVGMLEHAAEVLDFRRHQQPGGRLLDVMDDALGRRVRAMRRAEGVVDVDVGERRELARERRVVLLFLGVEPQVLEQDDAARRRRLRSPLCAGSPMQSSANTTGRSEQLRQVVRDRLQRVLADSACPSAARGASTGSPSRAVRRARTGSSAATPGCACRPRSRRS